MDPSKDLNSTQTKFASAYFFPSFFLLSQFVCTRQNQFKKVREPRNERCLLSSFCTSIPPLKLLFPEFSIRLFRFVFHELVILKDLRKYGNGKSVRRPLLYMYENTCRSSATCATPLRHVSFHGKTYCTLATCIILGYTCHSPLKAS